MAIFVYTGIPGSGKTLKMAEIAMTLLKRNKKYFNKTGVKRMLVSNIKFAEHIEKQYDGFIEYWTELDFLIKKRDCDIIFDEIATYMDSTQWALMPLEAKRFLQLHRHYGIDIYGTTQDFLMIDKAMRRLVKSAYQVRKIIGSRDKSATLPPVENPWGLCVIRQIDQETMEEDRQKQKLSGVSLLFITKELCNVYDTTQELQVNAYPPLRHIVRTCSDPNCGFHKLVHL